MYLWSRIKYFFARITPNNLVEFYIMLRMPKKAASFLTANFDKLAPIEARVASGNYRLKKWDFMGAAKYFVEQCKPSSAVAILNEWHKIGPESFKPPIILNMMLTIPHMAFGMTEEDKKAKVSKIITLVTVTNKPLLMALFTKGTVSALLEVMQIDGRDNPEFVPAFVPFLVFDLPERKAAILFILLEMKANNPGQVDFLMSKLPNEKAGSINNIKDNLKIGMMATQDKLNAPERKKGEKKKGERMAKKEETLTELMQSLSNFIDQFVESEGEEPEDEKSDDSGEES